jgi:NMD protein affecting ribosome stability and mRNA decay
MKGKTSETGFSQARQDRSVQEEYQHDAYKSRGKLPEPTVCPTCKAVYHEGRWTWATSLAKAHEEMCPACHRTHDKFPAGYVTIAGEYWKTHKDDVLHIARNEEKRAKAEHPLRRIMHIDDKADSLVIMTTDTHLPRAIGEAIHHAHHGELDLKYAEDEKLIRVTWTR